MSRAILDAAGVTRVSEPTLTALYDAERASVACASAMIAEGGMASESALALDCADLCAVAARVLGRRGGDPAVAEAAVGAAVRACEASAVACGRHADHHEHCRLHSDAARECAELLRRVPAGG